MAESVDALGAKLDDLKEYLKERLDQIHGEQLKTNGNVRDLQMYRATQEQMCRSRGEDYDRFRVTVDHHERTLQRAKGAIWLAAPAAAVIGAVVAKVIDLVWR